MKQTHIVLAGDIAVEAGVMPSMAQAEPLGLKAVSIEREPSRSTYRVAIWPLASSWFRTLSGAMKRPSPWEMGTL